MSSDPNGSISTTREPNTGRKKAIRALSIACAAAALTLAAVTPDRATVTSAQAPARQYRSALSTAQTYFQVLNAGMSSGTFANLASVFAANATLTKSGTDGTTAVYHGVTEITGYYQSLYQKVPNWQWTTDELRPLSKTTVLAYEHAGSPPLSVASRCIHVFVIKKGKIVSYDWAAFFPGQK